MTMHLFWIFLAGFLTCYVILSLVATYLVQNYPRRPVDDRPDWGKITDVTIPAVDGGFLEVWRVEPDIPACGTVVLAHGWGRNRGRMVHRARIFGRMGFTTVLHSARDHGGSSPKKYMNAMKFCEDIETVLSWIAQPVILYGHSAGAGGAILTASRNPDRIQLLFLEGCYADTEESLLSLYRWVNPLFGKWVGPAILFWMNLFYHHALDKISPAKLATRVTTPVLLIHGKKDRRFPVEFAYRLQASFWPGQAELFVASEAGHSDSSLSPGYPEALQHFLNQHRKIWDQTR